MNVIIGIQDFMIENTFFLETKKNILMDGNFTKIIYSDELVTLNGIYLLFPILNYNTNRVINKKYIYFQINNNDNLQIIKELMVIENKILYYYKKNFCCSKQPSYILSEQLRTGNIKIYKDATVINRNLATNYIIKISGIWEDKSYFGITYKFIEVME